MSVTRFPSARLTSQYFDTAAKADRRLAAAINTGNNVDLHRAGKAANALDTPPNCSSRSYSASAARTVRHYKKIQTVLGDHQDRVVAADTLRRLRVLAGTTAGEDGFTFGLLYAAETQAAQHARAGVAAPLS
jgi:CHAD domain-containing protein